MPDSGLSGRLLNLDEAADYLNVPKRWLGDAVRARTVRCTRIGKHIRFTHEHIQAIIRDGEQVPVNAKAADLVPVHRGRARSRL
jgi:excisionase family DNA binding protein